MQRPAFWHFKCQSLTLSFLIALFAPERLVATHLIGISDENGLGLHFSLHARVHLLVLQAMEGFTAAAWCCI